MDEIHKKLTMNDSDYPVLFRLIVANRYVIIIFFII